jgi:hypothetical protein
VTGFVSRSGRAASISQALAAAGLPTGLRIDGRLHEGTTGCAQVCRQSADRLAFVAEHGAKRGSPDAVKVRVRCDEAHWRRSWRGSTPRQ